MRCGHTAKSSSENEWTLVKPGYIYHGLCSRSRTNPDGYLLGVLFYIVCNDIAKTSPAKALDIGKQFGRSVLLDMAVA